MKNELQQLESKIRQALPRLQELSDGCKIDYYENIYTIGVDCTLGLNNQIEVDENMTIFSDEYDIIGHNIYLSDVLEWQSTNGRGKYSHFEVSKGEGYFCIYDGEESDSVLWDLSKPLLKDQPKEVIEYLNGLK